MNYRIFSLALCLFFVCSFAQAATVPQIASGAGRELDRQLAARLEQESPVQGVSLFVTTPVDINDLDAANTLARQMEEELTRWFTQAGYSVQEIRKSSAMVFDPPTGEMLLTREADRLAANQAAAGVVLVGTYTVTQQNVRFNLRLVQTGSHDVLAMSTVSVPITSELNPLLDSSPGGVGGTPIEPTVVTRMP